MKARVFRGAIRPAMWLGMPFVFGICWTFASFLTLIYIVAFLRDDGIALGIGVMVHLFVSLSIFFLVRSITKDDPYRLRQLRLRLMLRLEQGNFGRRGEFAYVPFVPGKPKRVKR